MPPKKNTKKETLAVEPRPVRNTRNQEVNYKEISASVAEKIDTKSKKNGEGEPKAKSSKASKTSKEPKKETKEVVENGEKEQEEEEEVVEKPAKKTTKKAATKKVEKPEEPKAPKRKVAEEKKPKTAAAKKTKKDEPVEEDNQEETPSEPVEKVKPATKPARRKLNVEPDSTVEDPKPKNKKKVEEAKTVDDKNIDVKNVDEEEVAPKKLKNEAPTKGRKTAKRQPKVKDVSDEVKKPAIEEPKKYLAENLECDKLSAKGDKWNLKICSWNVDGYRAWVNKKAHEFLQAEKPDIFCIQEVRCPTDKLPSDIILADYHNYWLCGQKDGYAGVGLLSKTMPLNIEYGLGNEELDTDGRIITAEYSTFYVVCTYVPNAGRGLVTLPKRLKWNEALLEHLKNLDKKKPVVLCGDMNVAHNEIDLANPKSNKKNAGFTPEERQGMTDMLGNGFVDTFRNLYPDKKGAYTFWSNMRNSRAKNVGWRLDYFILSERIAENVCEQALRTDVMGSDHCPVTLFMHMRGLPEREIQRGSDAMIF